MTNVRFVANNRGVQQLLKSPEMQAMLQDLAQDIQADAGEGYSAQVSVGRTRARGYVLAETPDAKRDQAKHHTLERAVGRRR